MVTALEAAGWALAMCGWAAGYGLFMRAVARGRYDTTTGDGK